MHEPKVFETLPLHSISWHPLPTQQSPRYLRSCSFLYLSCCLPIRASPYTALLLLLGHALSRPTSPVTATPRTPLHHGHAHCATPACPAWAGTGHVVTISSCICETARPTRRPQQALPGRSTSPQELESITVRLPCGTCHGKGPARPQPTRIPKLS
jgi:hypothetical protein